MAALFGRVIAPRAVAAELQQERTPEKVRAWMAAPPPWLEIVSVSDPDPTIDLGAGEVEALTPAGRRQGALLLLDERRAVRYCPEAWDRHDGGPRGIGGRV